MSQIQAAESSSSSDEDIDTALASAGSTLPGRNDRSEARQDSKPIKQQDADSPSRLSAVPMQKRRRVTRACDECRRKKIKCDGRQPCTHCQVYTYDCTYDQPSNRRRNPDPQHLEALEARLEYLTRELRKHDPDFDPTKHDSFQSARNSHADPDGELPGQDSMLESMVENTGSLDLDDDGYFDFYGHSSGRAFLKRMRDQFGQLAGISESSRWALPPPKDRQTSVPEESPSSTPSQCSRNLLNTKELPSKDCARLLCENALDDACAVLRFVHQPTFYAMFDRIYGLSIHEMGPEEKRFIPLLYAVLALGALFATADQSHLMTGGFKTALEQGSRWYNIARSMIDMTDIRDLVTLQTVLFIIMFLQSSAKLSTCYSHIGISITSALRMGLHRSISHNFNPVEHETRKRVFWCIIKLDRYVGALLGLPQMISDEDIDQEQPLELDDNCITSAEIHPMPEGQVSLMAGFNAHTRIVDILMKVVRYIYPIKSSKAGKPHTSIVSYARIREIEGDLQRWLDTLPQPLKPDSGDTRRPFIRIQHILRMAYAHISMFLYRPYLHYASGDATSKKIDKPSYACAAACVSVSRNIVHLTEEMKKGGLLVGSYWFYMYTTFFAIIALLFYVLENSSSSSSIEILKDACAGRDTLARLASKSLAADRCTIYLNDLFDQLSDTLKAIPTQPSSRKRPLNNQSSNAASISSKRTGRQNTATGSQGLAVSQRRNWQSGHETQSRDTPNAGVDGSFYRPSPNPVHQISANHPLRSPGGGSWAPTPTGQGVNAFGAMMFPSGDPFAYPAQPLTTLENRQRNEPVGQMQQTPQSFLPSTGIDTSSSVFGNVGDYGTLPSGQDGPYTGLQRGYYGAPAGSMNMQTGSEAWQGQRQTSSMPFRMPPNEEYDNLFGEDWSGWMR